MAESKESKQRLQKVFQCGQFTIHWGFIPMFLYLGFKRGADPGMPELTILRLQAHLNFPPPAEKNSPPPNEDRHVLD
ncbi:mitochondrial import receptor subunit TOM7 homolog [Xenopus laevis]|uniref:Mitochondrial import receptor subunit TOM7 homolog n=1 Tax=Xenopus laevis TaxID=8355 RepID=A0A8J1KVX3_XENLA|nr:mitochondrial import receptor subunit TOM7 homolog [Xenopus laevis]